MNQDTASLKNELNTPDFFGYWEALGFFDNLQIALPPEYFVIFDIARIIASQESKSKARSALKELLQTKPPDSQKEQKSKFFNWRKKVVPLSDRMEIEYYKTIYDLKKAIPRELMWGARIFNIKLFTKTLLVQRHYETETDVFKPISQVKDMRGREKSGFEQKFYLLLDRSRSMDNHMRSFYSKSIIVEFLRKKLESKAKLFFRAFDTKPGELLKIESKDDYTSLIEKIIFTTTGGTSTNMQRAVFQAIDDINSDKDITDAEILVITDCLVHDLDVNAMKEKLKDIKLNILKIGLDLAEPNVYEIEQLLKESGYKFDPFSVNIKEIKNKLESKNSAEPLSRIEHKIYEYMLDRSQRISKDIKKISEKFIEIDDIHPGDFASISPDTIELLNSEIQKLSLIDPGRMSIHELAMAYKKAFFLGQYIELLLEIGTFPDKSLLRQAMDELSQVRQKMLTNPYLLNLISDMEIFKGDKRTLKAAKKTARKKIMEIAHQEKIIKKDDIKNAELIISMGSGGSSGNAGGLFLILLLKLWEAIKSVIQKLRKFKD